MSTRSMLAVLAASLVVAATSKRVQQEDLHTAGAARHVAKSAASCEYLESTFQSRVSSIRDILEQRTNSTAAGLSSNARLMLRSFQALRLVRRAATCSWVEDGRSEDMAVVQQAAAVTLAENPCADAARQELAAAGDTEDAQFQALQRATQVLLSETCEASAPGGEVVQGEEEIWQRADEDEAQAESALDELVDETLANPGVGSSLLESSGVMRILRAVGAVLFGLLAILSCTLASASVGAVLGWLFSLVVCFFLPAGQLGCAGFTIPLHFLLVPAFGAIGGVAGGVPCSTRLIQQLE